jgi:preprotein translocase subunit SecY
MKNFSTKLNLILRDPILRKRIIFTLGALVIFRLLATIPIPGIDTLQLQRLFNNNQFFGLLNIFSGGGLSNLSIVMLGVGPYITSSIIMQLFTMMSPTLKAMYQEEGEAGRMKFAQYSRMLTVPLALVQAFGFITLLQKQGVVPGLNTFGLLTNVIIITSGSILLMWIGELISEFGIGNGTSLIIFSGIVAYLPRNISQLSFTFDVASLPTYIGFVAAALIVIYAVVVITEAERPIPVTYAKRVRGMKVYGHIYFYKTRKNTQRVFFLCSACAVLAL